VTLEHDDLDELAGEIRRLIESNKVFLERVNDEDYEDEDEADSDQEAEPESDPEAFEEL
jgi:cell pole-organizing protein PopZ